MATFRIHEDACNYFPSSRPAISKIPIKSTEIPKKILNVKGNNDVKRIPLRVTSNNANKKYLVLAEKKVQDVKDLKCPKNIVERNKEKQIQNIIAIDSKILNEINKNCAKSSKEVFEYSAATREKFSFSLDHLFLTTSDYHSDILEYMLHLEKTLRRPPMNYMQKQPEINFKMRSILVDWLAAVSEEYNLQPQTLHLAVNYIDVFLSQMSVVKVKFQLVGAAAMMIAAKYEEIYPPDTKEWTYLTADSYSTKQLLRMEQLILRVLQFDLSHPTSFSFISHLCTVTNLPKKVMLLSMYFSELVLLEGGDYIQYLPSQLAYSAVALALHTLNEKVVWPKQLASITGYSLKQLSPIIKKQHKSFEDSPTRPQQAIQQKFKTTKYERVSTYKPQKLDLCDMMDD